MALSMNLADELTCPIDLEIFENPMSLKCLHNLCKKDVDKMIDEDGLLQCPICMRVSERRDIKRDFRIQKLIDLHHDHINRLKDKQVCELCDEEPAVGICHECNIYIGDRCTRGHSKLPATKTHAIYMVSDIKAAIEEKLQRVLITMEEAIQQFEHAKARKLDDNAKTKSLFSDAISRINDSEKQIISEVRKVHQKLRQKVEKEHGEQTRNFDSCIETVDTQRASFIQDMNIIKDTLSKNDQQTLLDEALINGLIVQSKQSQEMFSMFVKSMEKDNQELTITVLHRDEVIKQLQQMQIAISLRSVHTNPEMASNTTAEKVTSTVKQSSWLAKPNPLRITGCMKQRDKKGHSSEIASNALEGVVLNRRSFSDYVSRTLQVTKLLHLHICDEPWKIADIGNQIWMVNITGYIDILSYSDANSVCKEEAIWIRKKSSMFGDEDCIEYNARAVAKAYDGSVIAACDGVRSVHKHKPHKDLGLVAVTANGVINHVVAEGGYQDVAYDNQYVYGLSYKTVTIHQYGSSKWSRIKQVQLQSYYHYFCISNNILTLSNSVKDVVDRYDLSNNTNSCLGIEGSALGEFSQPCVACSDAHGQVLVCNCRNHRLQLYMSDNTWRVLKLSEEIELPLHATVDHLGQLLVLTSEALFKLT